MKRGDNMGRPLSQIQGMRFGRLVVLERVTSAKDGHSRWICQCDCGNVATVTARNLKIGITKSCGCIHKEQHVKRLLKHGYASDVNRKKEYIVWNSIKDRCYNKNYVRYHYYGGRGIKVCERWLNNFQAFLDDMGECPSPTHSIDRIDVNGDYEPRNCRWATSVEQARNKRVRKNNKSGVEGVFQDKKYGSWRVSILVDGKRKHLGSYKAKEEAIKVRRNAEVEYWNKHIEVNGD